MRRSERIISALALLAIIWSVRFAFAQERRRTPQYLQGMYQELNAKYFEKNLPPARLEWVNGFTAADLKDAMGITFQESDDSFVIQVDRKISLSGWMMSCFAIPWSMKSATSLLGAQTKTHTGQCGRHAWLVFTPTRWGPGELMSKKPRKTSFCRLCGGRLHRPRM
jgi:hypothetical protein